jgi:hypothetical protein
MRFHDFHLDGYSVSDSGARIVLHLDMENQNGPKNWSHIEFSGVACYHFDHSTGAIITDVIEASTAKIVRDNETTIGMFAIRLGLQHWDGDLDAYIQTLEQKGFRCWQIESAIGFSGFVICQTAKQLEYAPESVGLPQQALV